MTLRILYLIDSLGVGGAERSLLEIARRFRRTSVAVCHLYPEDSLRPAFEAAGIPVYSLEVKGRYPGPQAWRKLRAVLQAVQPDLLHITGLFAGLLGRSMGKVQGVRMVDSFTNETYTPAHYASLPPRARLKLRALYALDRLTLRWVDRIIANSETVRLCNASTLHVPLERVEVIYRGRDPQPFLSPDAERMAAVADALPCTHARPRLVNVARLIPRKGQQELVAAMPAVLERYPNAVLYIAGEGHYRAALTAEIAATRLQAHVHLLGTVQAIPELLALNDVFVFASHFEGLPGVLIEAMLAGKPIVAVDTPVHRELIAHGQSGLLVTPQQAGALAEGILWMLDHPDAAEVMGRKARQMALETFHIDGAAARYEAFYRSLVEPRSKG